MDVANDHGPALIVRPVDIDLVEYLARIQLRLHAGAEVPVLAGFDVDLSPVDLIDVPEGKPVDGMDEADGKTLAFPHPVAGIQPAVLIPERQIMVSGQEIKADCRRNEDGCCDGNRQAFFAVHA